MNLPIRAVPLASAFVLACGVLPAIATTPQLAFGCGGPVQATVTCRLSGQAFFPSERVRILYRITAATVGGMRQATIRRTALTDRHGAFTRPALSFAVDPRVGIYRVTSTVVGMRGDRATIAAAGTP